MLAARVLYHTSRPELDTPAISTKQLTSSEPFPAAVTTSHIELPHYTTGWRPFSAKMSWTGTAPGSLVVVPVSLSGATSHKGKRW